MRYQPKTQTAQAVRLLSYWERELLKAKQLVVADPKRVDRCRERAIHWGKIVLHYDEGDK